MSVEDVDPPRIENPMVPEIILADGYITSRVGPVLDSLTANIEAGLAAHPREGLVFTLNGWTPRMMAWRTLIAAMLDALAEAGVTFEPPAPATPEDPCP